MAEKRTSTPAQAGYAAVIREPKRAVDIEPLPLRSTITPLDKRADWLRSWEALNRSSWDTPLLSESMLIPALRYFGNGKERLATVRRGDRVVAMALLRPTSFFAYATFQPSQLPLATLLMVPNECLDAIASSLLDALPPHVLVLSIEHLDPHFVPRSSDSVVAEFRTHMTTGAIDWTTGRDRYFSLRPASLRQNVSRRTRRAAETFGEPRLEVLEHADAVEAYISLYAATELSGWKGREGTAVRADGEQGDFYREMLLRAASMGEARMFVLRFGDVPVAQQIAIERDGVLYLMKTTYDERHKQYAPGVLQRMHVLRWAAARSIERVELYGRLSEWQQPFVTSTRDLYHVTCFRSRATRRVRDAVKWIRSAKASGSTQEAPQAAAKPTGNHAGLSSPFVTAEWFDLLERTCFASSTGRSIRIAASSNSDAFLPLWYRPSPIGGTLTGLSNFYTPLFAPIVPLAEQGELAVELTRFLRETRGWSTLRLQPLADDAPWFSALTRELQRAGMLFDCYFCFGNWYADVQGIDSASYEKGLPSHLRHTLAQAEKRMRSVGGFHLDIETGTLDPETLQKCINAFRTVYGRSWKRAEPYPCFIPDLFALASHKGWLRYACLRQGDRPIASQLWLTHAGVASIYKLAYDADYARYSPGSLLTQALIRHAIDVDHVREIDYLIGDDPYKQGWMKNRRTRSGLIAFNRASPAGLVHAAIHYAGRRVRRLVRQPVNQAA